MKKTQKKRAEITKSVYKKVETRSLLKNRATASIISNITTSTTRYTPNPTSFEFKGAYFCNSSLSNNYASIFALSPSNEFFMDIPASGNGNDYGYYLTKYISKQSIFNNIQELANHQDVAFVVNASNGLGESFEKLDKTKNKLIFGIFRNMPADSVILTSAFTHPNTPGSDILEVGNTGIEVDTRIDNAIYFVIEYVNNKYVTRGLRLASNVVVDLGVPMNNDQALLEKFFTEPASIFISTNGVKLTIYYNYSLVLSTTVTGLNLNNSNITRSSVFVMGRGEMNIKVKGLFSKASQANNSLLNTSIYKAFTPFVDTFFSDVPLRHFTLAFPDEEGDKALVVATSAAGTSHSYVFEFSSFPSLFFIGVSNSSFPVAKTPTDYSSMGLPNGTTINNYAFPGKAIFYIAGSPVLTTDPRVNMYFRNDLIGTLNAGVTTPLNLLCSDGKARLVVRINQRASTNIRFEVSDFNNAAYYENNIDYGDFNVIIGGSFVTGPLTVTMLD